MRLGSAHKTTHTAEPIDGSVWVICSCGWKRELDVNGLTWVEAMTLIYDARDRHEGEADE